MKNVGSTERYTRQQGKDGSPEVRDRERVYIEKKTTTYISPELSLQERALPFAIEEETGYCLCLEHWQTRCRVLIFTELWLTEAYPN